MRLRPVVCVVALSMLGLAHADAAARSAPQDPCAKKSAVDLLCRRYGSVTEVPPWSTATAPLVVRRRAVALSSGSTVDVGSLSLATIAFGRQAQCAFGVDGRATELVTRYGGAVGASLYWQRIGTSRCTFLGKLRPQSYFCELSVHCPVVVDTRGHVEEVARVGAPVRVASLAHAAEVTTPVTLDFCAGRFSVQVSDEFGGGSIGGDGSVDVNGTRELAHVRVTVTKVDTLTQTGDGTVETHFFSLEAHGIAGRGDCTDRGFVGQRRWAHRR